MNVLVVTSGYPPEHSGSGLRTHRTYSRLAAQHPGLSWRVLTRRPPGSEGNGQPQGPESVRVIKSYSFGRLLQIPLRPAAEWLALQRHLRLGLLDEIDLLHVSGFTWASVFLVREAKKRGIPVIRELTSFGDIGMALTLAGRAFARVVRYLNRSADLLIAISPRLEEGVRDSGVESPVWCRPNPVDTSRFRPVSQSEKEVARTTMWSSKEWGASDVILLHIGRFRPNKNQLLLVQALAHLPPRFKLVLVGPVLRDDFDYLEAVKREVALRKLEDRTYIDPRFRRDPEEMMAAADIFVFPSEREGLGNVMLEALCTGLPVVASRIRGVTDWIIDPPHNGFLAARSGQDLAEKVLDAEPLSNRREEIARQAAQRFDPWRIDERYWEYLRNLTSFTEEPRRC